MKRNSLPVIASTLAAIPLTFSLAGCKEEGQHVKAGGWICDTQIAAVRYYHVRKYQTNLGFPGCEQMGIDVPVNILGHASLNGATIVNVGNAGGAGWTVDDDIE